MRCVCMGAKLLLEKSFLMVSLMKSRADKYRHPPDNFNIFNSVCGILTFNSHTFERLKNRLKHTF